MELQSPNCPIIRTRRRRSGWGEVLRLRAGPHRIMYTVEGDLITILRVDRRAG